METDVKMDNVEKKPLGTEFINIQPITKKKKENISLEELANQLTKIGNSNEVKRAQLIDKNKALNTLLNKAFNNKASMKDLESIKTILYLEDDYEYETDMIEKYTTIYPNDKLSNIKKLAISDILSERANQIKETLNDKDKLNELIDYVKDNVLPSGTNENMIINDQDLNPMEWANMLPGKTALEKFKEDNANEWKEWENKYGDNKKVSNTNNSHNQNGNNFELSEEEKKLKKTILENIKLKRKGNKDKITTIADQINAASTNLNKIIDILENDSKETISNNKDYMASHWGQILNIKNNNPRVLLQQFGNKCMNNANNKQFIIGDDMFTSLTAVLVSILNRLDLHEDAIYNFYDINKLTISKEVNLIYGGKTAKDKFNNRLKYNYAKSLGQFKEIPKEEWDKLSPFEKLEKKFKFNNFSQMPPKGIWKNLNLKEKEAFIKKRNEFRNKQIVNYHNNITNAKDEKEKISNLVQFDIFNYYCWKDKRGFFCPIKNYTQFEDSLENKQIIEDINGILDEYSKKKLIFNVYYDNGVKKYTYGKSIRYVSLLRNKYTSNNKKFNKIYNNKNIPLTDDPKTVDEAFKDTYLNTNKKKLLSKRRKNFKKKNNNNSNTNGLNLKESDEEKNPKKKKNNKNNNNNQNFQ